MKEATIYIPPDNDEYTGYNTFILSGANTTDIEYFQLPEEGFSQKQIWEEPQSKLGEDDFPIGHAKRFINRDRLDFYETEVY